MRRNLPDLHSAQYSVPDLTTAVLEEWSNIPLITQKLCGQRRDEAVIALRNVDPYFNPN